MSNQNFNIDLVYLWVDGSDPEWIKKKLTFTGKVYDNIDLNCKGRYTNNDELKYSLRSVEKYIPWIHKIFIITDNQIPKWLNTEHSKIQIVDHKEILPKKALPCFNSTVIEYFLYKIPNLSEHFLYANDDMFFNVPLTSEYFFSEDGSPIVRLKKKPGGKWRYYWKEWTGKKLTNYRLIVLNAALLVEQKHGTFYSGIPHHNVDGFCKTDFKKAVEVEFKEQVNSCLPNHLRSPQEIHRSAFSYFFLATGCSHLTYVSQTESCRAEINSDFQNYIETKRPSLFCLNDNERATDEDRKKVKAFLDKTFPKKSDFEK